jgi:hypothetical protein
MHHIKSTDPLDYVLIKVMSHANMAAVRNFQAGGLLVPLSAMSLNLV